MQQCLWNGFVIMTISTMDPVAFYLNELAFVCFEKMLEPFPGIRPNGRINGFAFPVNKKYFVILTAKTQKPLVICQANQTSL